MSTMTPEKRQEQCEHFSFGWPQKDRAMRGFSAKIINKPASAANRENIRRRMRRARYGGSGITASSRFQ
jgi:hypothetical protein